MFKHEYVENRDEHANIEDENRDEHANVECENMDEHPNVEDENIIELISIVSNPEENVNIVNDHDTTATVTNEAIEVNVIIATGRENESSVIENNDDIINVENVIEKRNLLESELVEKVNKVKMRKCLMCDFEAATGSEISR